MPGFLLIFDLDGTLVDSVPDLTASLNEVLRRHGYPPLTQAEVRPMIGDGVATLVARGFAARGGGAAEAEAAMPDYVAHYEANATRTSLPFPGVAETLARLRTQGYATAVCTNKLQRASEIMLGDFKLDSLFDAVAGGDRFAVKKPDAGHITGLIDLLGGDRDRAVMIGDSENDAASAHAAGIPLVLMAYGYARADPATLGAKCVLQRFDELPDALDQLGLAP